MAAEMHFIQTIIGVGILLAAAKLMAELFSRIKLPIVLGELLAGMIVGPFALGMFFIYDGKPLLQIDANLQLLGEIGAIVILFMAGLEMTPREFLRGGKSSFTVGTLGVVIPFAAGYFVFQFFGFDALQSMLIATALTATSIAISIQVLNEFGKIKTPEARMIIGAAVVDDILAIAVLSVVSSIAAAWNYDSKCSNSKRTFTSSKKFPRGHLKTCHEQNYNRANLTEQLQVCINLQKRFSIIYEKHAQGKWTHYHTC